MPPAHPPSEPGDSTRPTVGDALLGAGVAVVVSAAVTTRALLGDDDVSPAAYLFALVLGALMLGRRRWPLATLLATLVTIVAWYAVDLPAIGAAAPAAAAFSSATERGHLRWAVPVGIAYLGLTTGVRALEGGEDPGHLLGYELVASAALLAAVIALGEALRSRRAWQVETALRTAREASEREAEERRRAEAERLLVARELHDVLAHTVAVISIHAEVAAEAVRPEDREVRDAIAAIRGASHDAMAELRATVRLLRAEGSTTADAGVVGPDAAGVDGTTRPVTGLADLDRVVTAARRSGLDVQVRTEGTPTALPGVVDVAAQRIVQESVTNVLRHAGATSATVELRYGPRDLSIRITDDGRGGPVSGAGFGLRGMQERVALLGGRFGAGPAEAGGFRIEAVLPLAGWR